VAFRFEVSTELELVWKTVGTDLMAETCLGKLLPTVALFW